MRAELRGGAVREGEHDDVAVVEGLHRCRRQREVAVGCQVWMHVAELASGTGLRGDGTERDLGMGAEQPHELTPHVAAGTSDAHPDHSSTPSLIYDET